MTFKISEKFKDKLVKYLIELSNKMLGNPWVNIDRLLRVTKGPVSQIYQVSINSCIVSPTHYHLRQYL